MNRLITKGLIKSGGDEMDVVTKTLSTESLFLREMVESDWVDVHKYAAQEIVCRYQPWGPNTLEESKAFVNQVMADASKNPRTRYVFAIINKDDEKLVGAGELNLRDAINNTGEIGYIVNPDYWGRGIATEAAMLLIDFGFEHFNLHRIFATCDPRNIGSYKVLEKVGMTKEGRIRENLKMKDGWRDSFLYSILKYEWGKS